MSPINRRPQRHTRGPPSAHSRRRIIVTVADSNTILPLSQADDGTSPRRLAAVPISDPRYIACASNGTNSGGALSQWPQLAPSPPVVPVRGELSNTQPEKTALGKYASPPRFIALGPEGSHGAREFRETVRHIRGEKRLDFADRSPTTR
jgi:hypothetical protein